MDCKILRGRLSTEYFIRKEKMASLQVPTISECKNYDGLPLAAILFGESPQELKEDFGLEPLLTGPRGDLWVSPSDLLIGKVVLKPPLTQKHIQALTHEGILEIGAEVEQKFLNEMRMEKERALKEQEKYLGMLCEAEKQQAMEEFREREEARYAKLLDEMQTMYEDRISELLVECADQVRDLQLQMEVEYNSLNVMWQEKLGHEIKKTTDRITEEFLQKMNKQEEVLVGIFTKQIKNLKVQKQCAIDFERKKCKEMVKKLQHELHCENISNLMYLLCKERRKCKYEKHEIERLYLSKISKLDDSIRKKSGRIKTLERTKKKQTRQLKVRERCIIEILRQFLKCIYFALKAAPTQGEFLLNIEKLIKYEIDDYCLAQKKAKPGVQTVPIPEDIEVIPEESVQVAETESVQEVREYSDALPAFYFNEKMYIREDFRDMLSCESLEKVLDDKHPLWNPDVEELLDVFRKVVEEKRNECELNNKEIKSIHSSVHFPQEDDESKPPSQRQSVLLSVSEPQRQRSGSHRKSSIIKTTSMDHNNEDLQSGKLSWASPSGTSKSVAESVQNNSMTPTMDMTQSKLELARDSLILHITTMERKSMQLSAKIVEEVASRMSDKEKLVNSIKTPALDDDEKDDFSAKITIQSEGSLDYEAQKAETTSRLLLVTDSYEIMKSKISLKNDRKSQLTFNVDVPAAETRDKRKRLSIV